MLIKESFDSFNFLCRGKSVKDGSAEAITKPIAYERARDRRDSYDGGEYNRHFRIDDRRRDEEWVRREGREDGLDESDHRHDSDCPFAPGEAYKPVGEFGKDLKHG